MIRSASVLCAYLVSLQSFAVLSQQPALVPQDYPTIQAAIDAGGSQVDILLAAGTYREVVKAEGMTLSLAPQPGSEGRVVLSADLNGDGEAEGRFLTTNGAGDARSGVLLTGLRFEVAGIEASPAEIEITDCTFTGGTTDLSRAVTVPMSHVSVRGCVFERIATVGGGAAILADVLVAEDSTFRACSTRSQGGAVAITRGTLARVGFEHNTARRGGGAVLVTGFPGVDGPAEILECVFTGNSATLGNGGAIYGPARIARSTFERNTTVGWGGAVYTDFGGDIQIVDCGFTENRAEASGAIYGDVNIDRCTFTRNTAETFGGAVTLTDGMISRSVFTGNRATARSVHPSQSGVGGAVCIESSPALIDDCTFVSNHAGRGGAVFKARGGYSPITRSRFAANSAVLFGGAICSVPASWLTESCVFVANEAPVGAAIGSSFPDFWQVEHCAFFDHPGSAVGSVRWSADQSLPGACVFGPGESVSIGGRVPAVGPGWSIGDPSLIGAGAIPFDPMIVRAPSDGGDGWGDNPITPDLDEGANDDFGDLRLLPGSPAIDAAGTASDAGELDFLGQPRLHDDPGVPSVRADIGPVEFQGASCLADVNADGAVSGGDFGAWVGAFNAGDQRADQNRDGQILPNDFTGWLQHHNAGCP
jgi:predicted outer membrane repeat protein